MKFMFFRCLIFYYIYLSVMLYWLYGIFRKVEGNGKRISCSIKILGVNFDIYFKKVI